MGRDSTYMFGMRHPRIAFALFALFIGVAALVGLAEAEGSVPRDAVPILRDYLLRVGVVAFLIGLGLMLIIFSRRNPFTRRPAQIAANFRWGARYSWVGAALAPILLVGAAWLNPVPMPWSPVPGVVALFGLLAPVLIFSALRVFALPSSLARPFSDDEAIRDGPAEPPTG